MLGGHSCPPTGRRPPDRSAGTLPAVLSAARARILRYYLFMAAKAASPTVRISSRGVMRLKAGHVWVYRSDVSAAADILPGSLVRVTDTRGKLLGTALYSTSSQIAIRMISREDVP